MKLAQLSPCSKIIRTETSLFSPPQSPHTCDGTPCSRIASINMSRTVSALLFVLAWRPVAYSYVINLIMLKNEQTHFTCISISNTMDNNSPCDQFMVSINVPKGIWSRDLIVSSFLFFTNTLPQALSQPINTLHRGYNMMALNTQGMCNLQMTNDISTPTGRVFLIIFPNQGIQFLISYFIIPELNI